jgi:FkbM family methyltransferase
MIRDPNFLIVTINLNNSDGLSLTLKSILSQVYSYYSCVVIDGGSTDGSDSAYRIHGNTNIHFYSGPDQGIYDAMNKGVKHATTDHDYVLFLNSGDVFSTPHILLIVAQAIEASRDWPDVIYGHTVLSMTGVSNATKSLSKARQLSNVILNIPMHHQSIYFKIKSLPVPPYDIAYRYAGDYEIIARLYNDRRSFAFLDYPLSIFDVGGASFDHKVQSKSYLELAAIRKKYFRLSNLVNTVFTAFLRLVNFIRQYRFIFSAISYVNQRQSQIFIRLSQVFYKAILSLRYYPLAALPRFTFIGLEHRAFMLSVASEVTHVIDVGMNKGQFLLAALQYLHINEYDGFEPIPSVFHSTKTLADKLDSSTKIRMYNLALAEDAKESYFHQSQKSDCSSLLEPVTTSQYNSQTECIKKLSLNLATLDSIIDLSMLTQNNVLLKIDTQGTELNILKGSEKLLKAGVIKHVYIEVSEIIHYQGQCFFSEILDYLTSIGYVLKALYNTNYACDGRLIFADAHFILLPRTAK